jgi:hypothetical protein
VRDRLLAAGTDRDLLVPPAPSEQPYPLVALGRPSAAAPPTRRRTFLAVTVTVLAAIAGMAALAFVPMGARSDGAEARATRATVAGVQTNRSPGKVAVRQPREANTPPRARSRGSTPAPATPAPATPAPTTSAPAATNKPRKTARRDLPTTRTFVWPSVPRATRYRVEFFRRGRKIFQASPLRPRLELPQQWQYKGRRFHLIRGIYRWRVRPAFGRSSTRLGQPITSSTWTFTG